MSSSLLEDVRIGGKAAVSDCECSDRSAGLFPVCYSDSAPAITLLRGDVPTHQRHLLRFCARRHRPHRIAFAEQRAGAGDHDVAFGKPSLISTWPGRHQPGLDPPRLDAPRRITCTTVPAEP